jgi:DNA-binding NarL/FixJ family response regulator
MSVARRPRTELEAVKSRLPIHPERLQREGSRSAAAATAGALAHRKQKPARTRRAALGTQQTMAAKPERAKESERRTPSRRERAIRVFVCADSPLELAGLESVVRAENSFALAGHSLGHESLSERLFAAGADVLLERRGSAVREETVIYEGSEDREPPPESSTVDEDREPNDAPDPEPRAVTGAGAIERSLMDDRSLINVPRVVLADEELFGELASAALSGETSIRAVLPAWASEAEIRAAVGGVAAGMIVLHPETSGYAADSLDVRELASSRRDRSGDPGGVRGETLSPRETEILDLLAVGLANKEIAFRLGISEHTVKFHVTSIFTKLDVTTRAAAVAIGIRRGLISL